MADTILNLMISHHALLELLFEKFRDEVKGEEEKKAATLSELTWEMKKHFFAEEGAIFDFPPLKIMNVWPVVEQLKKEHIEMLEMLQNFSDNLQNIKEGGIEDFHNLLESHRKIEELNLYPKIDKELLPEQKSQIITRVNQIPAED